MKDIVLNVLFILVMLFITQIFLDWQSKRMSVFLRKLTLYIASSTGILFVMTFSITVNPQYMFDIRVVPFVAGSLYGGPIVTIALYISLVLYRTLFGVDLGLVGAAFNYGLLAFILIFISRHFYKDRLRVKYSKAILVIISHTIFSHIIFTHILFSGLAPTMFWLVLFVKLITTLLIILFVETMQQYFKLKHQLLELEKMELVYHLSAAISHEVRNGLTSARGFIQLTKEQENDPQNAEYLRIATEEIDRTESIIHDFLTFSKPTLRLEKESHLDHLINHTVTLIEPLANMNSISIHKDLQHAKISGDQNLIQQSLLNIFKNAIEAMPNGGVLDIRLQQTDKQFIITVSDKGIGMNPDQIKRLGTPYYSTKGQKGTGLGMMVAYRVINELNGRIEVSSTLNVGSTFTIYLPRMTATN